MGSSIAAVFLAAGYRTTVWNRPAAKAEPLVAQGALRAETAAGAIAASPLATWAPTPASPRSRTWPCWAPATRR
ncbi:NAD(P)-binding domain-containing protein (plasmid) [Embleya sp. NBC_00896]|nr:NAD(P)-binding domain-containing protein [Embleya sp. NBC_00896]